MAWWAVLVVACVRLTGARQLNQAVAPFTLVVLPDTQYYSRYSENAAHFVNQTQWIVDEVEHRGNPQNIAFVTHLGDVVNDGFVKEQWVRANVALSKLGPPGGPFVVPFSILPGNHDFFVTSSKITGAALYLENFGPKRFANAPWFGGADASGLNSYQLFSGGGFEFLHIALEWEPNQNIPERNPSPLEWASQIILAHPTMPVILSTHEYINDEPPGRSDCGDAIFNSLVKKHDQIFLVLSGHFHNAEPGWQNNARRTDGEWHQVSQNNFGRPVVEVLQDYQDYPHGGDGWLRLIRFDIANGELRFETYSTVLGQYATDTVEDEGQRASKFTIPLDFATRLHIPSSSFFRHQNVSAQSVHRKSFLGLDKGP